MNNENLTSIACVPCQGGVPTLTDDEIAALKPRVPDWEVASVEGVRRLRRAYTFPNFREALEFTDAIGELAERENHHPDIHLSWGRVVVEVWTHKIQGLHRNDFILAAKTDEIYRLEA